VIAADEEETKDTHPQYVNTESANKVESNKEDGIPAEILREVIKEAAEYVRPTSLNQESSKEEIKITFDDSSKIYKDESIIKNPEVF